MGFNSTFKGLKIIYNFDNETFHRVLAEIFDFQTFYDVMKPYKNQFHRIPLSVLKDSCLYVFITSSIPLHGLSFHINTHRALMKLRE